MSKYKYSDMLWLAEIKYADAPELGSILVRVKAERKSVAEYKVCKYIENNLSGKRVYSISRFDMIGEI